MYDFHYIVMKPKYGDIIDLLMTDTDGFVYNIKTDDFYDVIPLTISCRELATGTDEANAR